MQVGSPSTDIVRRRAHEPNIEHYAIWLLCAIAFAVPVASCATPYQPASFRGGYSETRLSKNSFRVFFRGNARTSEERASDFALLRASELTLDHGFRYFVIFAANSSSEPYTVTSPVQSQTYTSTVGGQTYSNTVVTGGQTTTLYKPRSGMIITCYEVEPETQDLIFDAELLKQSIQAKYDIEPEP